MVSNLVVWGKITSAIPFLFVQWVELHGDRAGYDDPAIVTGLGTIDGQRYMFIGQQKGRNTKENIQRNFGMPTPHGYVSVVVNHHLVEYQQIHLIYNPGNS